VELLEMNDDDKAIINRTMHRILQEHCETVVRDMLGYIQSVPVSE
jgi:hypothetical protein